LSQGAAQYPIDFQVFGIDMLIKTSEKVGSVRGTGVLYVKDGINIYPL